MNYIEDLLEQCYNYMYTCEQDLINHRNNHNKKLDINNSANDIKKLEVLTLGTLFTKLNKALARGYNPNLPIMIVSEDQKCKGVISIIYDPNDVILLSNVSIENSLSNMEFKQRKMYESCIKIL